jgi:hypothetical protein
LAIFEGRGLKKWVAFLQRKKGERMIRRNESLSMFSSLTSYCQVIKPSITVFLPFIIHGFSPSLLHNPWFFFFYYSYVSLYFPDGQRYLQANLRIHYNYLYEKFYGI